MVSWLRWCCRLSGAAAAEQVRAARHLTELPETAEAFAAEEIGFQHAAVIARSAEEVGDEAAWSAEAILVEAARRLDPGRLWLVTARLRYCRDPDGALADSERAHERRRLDLSQTMDGVFVLDGLLDAEGGAVLRTALQALTGPRAAEDKRSGGQRRADALVELARRQLDGGGLPEVGGQRPHLTLTARLDTLKKEPGASAGELEWAGPVPAETVRRLACDAALTPVLLGPDSAPLVVGRGSRVVPPALRRALASRDGGCRFPGCDRPVAWTDAHHLQHWSDGGATRLGNLVLLCRRHHRKVHEEGWQLSWSADRALTALPP